ncbi:MAG TPA: DUF5615 family PIN-like protein [Rhodoblastus sp.]|nr:DUF5615 family PIN-like protein [Rhodoblastus sp.]
MRFLADENFPASAIAALEAAGCDIASVARDRPGSKDFEVLARAQRESRVLLTFDKDFGELAKGAATGAFGVILFRIPIPRPADVGAVLSAFVLARNDWTGHFSVVEAGRIRMRRLGPIR